MAKARSSAKQSRAQAQAQAQQPTAGGHALSSKLARYLDPEASLDKVRPSHHLARRVTSPAVLTLSVRLGPGPALWQDQLLDAVHWIRQAVGLVCGLLWGAVPLVGAVWIALSVPPP